MKKQFKGWNLTLQLYWWGLGQVQSGSHWNNIHWLLYFHTILKFRSFMKPESWAIRSVGYATFSLFSPAMFDIHNILRYSQFAHRLPCDWQYSNFKIFVIFWRYRSALQSTMFTMFSFLDYSKLSDFFVLACMACSSCIVNLRYSQIKSEITNKIIS